MNSMFVKAALFGAGAMFGAGLASLIIVKSLEKHYQDFADEQIRDVKDYYARVHKEGRYSDPVTLAKSLGYTTKDNKKYAELVEDEGYSGTEEPEIEGPQGDPGEDDDRVEIVRNVFIEKADKLAEDEDLLERENRSVEAPYVISVDEFMEDEPEFDKLTVTLFDGDGIVITDNESIMDNSNEILGLKNLEKFGVASSSPDLVYIRNELIKVDFEVARDPRTYPEVVLGIDPDEDEKPKVKKMRNDE